VADEEASSPVPAPESAPEAGSAAAVTAPAPVIATEAAAPEPQPTAALEGLEPQQAGFTGTGREYFQIWIVNLLLTIATLGIYSAWAKVRRLQYFYRHTRLAGAGFDYHGRPMAILKGRIVAAVLFGIYTAAGYFSPWHALAAAAAIATIMPWLLAKSFRFRCRNTSYRGMRFHFHGTAKQAYWVFLGLPVLALLSLFTLVPFAHHRMRRYQMAHAAYGRTRFRFSAPVGEFYITYVGVLGVMMGAFVLVLIVAMVATLAAMAVFGRDSENPLAFGAIGVAIGLGYMFAIVMVQAFFTARIQNAVWSSTQLDEHRFVLRLEVPGLFAIMFTNLLATIVTLGLFRPFAQVRLARYYAESFVLVPHGSLDALLPDESEDVAAFGEEAADIFDFDMSF
jgi:uncharacterized membrane protein YjgN (DUF898 family)